MLPVFFDRAADWKLDEPAWSGRMKITAKGKMAFIKLEDKNTGKRNCHLLQLTVINAIVTGSYMSPCISLKHQTFIQALTVE